MQSELSLNLESPSSQPLYERLRNALRQEVERGVLRPGDRLPSFAELRTRYGIHKATVERAHLMLEQEGLVVREQGRGTFVAHRAPATGTIGLLGVSLLMSQASPFWAKLLGGIWAGLSPQPGDGGDARGARRQLLLFDEYTPQLCDRVDGLLINSANRDYRFITLPSQLPCVSLLVANRAGAGASVVADDYAAGRALTRHLLELGHRRIAFLANRESTEIAPRRIAGYRDALLEYSVEPQPHWLRSWRHRNEVDFTAVAREAMEEWLRHDWRDLACTALVCQNDEAALGAVQALENAGYAVPGQVSVAGFDGAFLDRAGQRRITTMEIPLFEIGRRGAQLLLEQVADATIREERAAHLTLPATLRVGETTAPL